MTPIQVLNHFAGKPKDGISRVAVTAEILGLSKQAVHKWLRDNRIPKLRQWELSQRSGGKLKVTK